MHTSTWSGTTGRDDKPVVVVFNHNGDYSGDVLVRLIYCTRQELDEYEYGGARNRGEPEPEYEDLTPIPYAAMRMLVARDVGSRQIAYLENISDEELLYRRRAT